MEERNVRKHNSNTHFVSTYQLCESQVRGHTMEKERNVNTTTIQTLSVLTSCVSHRYEVTQWRRRET